MRVLHIHNRYRSVGGEERHIDLLAEWLPRAGVEVCRLELESPADSSLVQRIRIGLGMSYRPAAARLLREVLARERPDIVHFHNLFPLLTPAAVGAARRSGVRVVLTVHNYRFACPAGTLLRNGRIHEDCVEGSSLLCGLRNARGVWSESLAYGAAIEVQRRLRLLHRWVDAYVAPCRFVATMLARARYPRNRIHTIYHGTPIAAAPSPGGDFMLYAGRLSPEKGVRTLLDAARLVPHIPLVIAGSGPLARVADEATGGGVSYVGYVDQARLSALRRDALAAVMPSEWFEVQPFGALESMAVGVPVLASRLGGLAEIVENGATGILVPHGDPEALAAAFASLWVDTARAADMGVRAWEYARAHFSPLEQAGRLAGLYRRLAPGRG